MKKTYFRFLPAFAFISLLGFTSCNKDEEANPSSDPKNNVITRLDLDGTTYIVTLNYEYSGPSAAGHLPVWLPKQATPRTHGPGI